MNILVSFVGWKRCKIGDRWGTETHNSLLSYLSQIIKWSKYRVDHSLVPSRTRRPMITVFGQKKSTQEHWPTFELLRF